MCHNNSSVLRWLGGVPHLSLWTPPTPLEEMARLRAALKGSPRLLMKRDDAIPFGFGGNKVRKLELVLADAIAAEADTLVTVGSVQSNHARATAAAAAKLGLGCHIIANGTPPQSPTANALLNELLGAEITYIASREERDGAMERTVERLREASRHPFAVPLGASTPLGALGFVRAVGEVLEQIPAPDVIVHASSSGGTQAGLVTGCVLHALETRVIGVSADEPAAEIESTVHRIVTGMGELLGCDGEARGGGLPDRGGRRLHRRRLCRAYDRLARSPTPRRARGGPLHRPLLYGEGAGGADQLRPRRPLPRGPNRAVLAYGRAGRTLRMTPV